MSSAPTMEPPLVPRDEDGLHNDSHTYGHIVERNGTRGANTTADEEAMFQSNSTIPDGRVVESDPFHPEPLRREDRFTDDTAETWPDSMPQAAPSNFNIYRAQTFAVVHSRAGTFGSTAANSPEMEDMLRICKVVLSIQDKVKRPARTFVNGKSTPPKLRDTIGYYMRRKTVERLIAGFHGVYDTSLCQNCKELDLKAEKFIVNDGNTSDTDGIVPRFLAGSGSGRKELGSIRQITLKSIWCAFCKLIVDSLREQHEFRTWLDARKLVEGDLGPREDEILDVICRASWQIDGQTRRHDTHDETAQRRHLLASDRRRARTRRIRIDWSRPGIEPSYLVLLAGPAMSKIETTNKQADFFGRHIETRESSVSLMQDWLHRCKQEHGKRCNEIDHEGHRNIREQPYFGVIDLEKSCVSKLPENEQYVALSYCWGKPRLDRNKAAQTVRGNIRAYQDRGALERIKAQIPDTINDAMTLARRLGMRYFWVDSLCIVQDSAETWQLNANVMDQIYSNAAFTICAADGEDAWEGLRGLNDGKTSQQTRNGRESVGRRYEQKIEAYSKDTRLMVSYPADSYIDKSKWNTRLLSRRCLIFVDGRVFFQCRSMVLREDIITEEQNGWSVEHRNTPLELLGDVKFRPLSVYIQCVELYTKRDLTKPTDILNAFTGVGNYIGRVLGRQGLLYGLPRSHFDWALLWQCSTKGDCLYRGEWDQAKDGKEQKPHLVQPGKFPSWSWCGWMHGNDSPARYYNYMIDGTMSNVQDWLVKHTWIVWYVRDGHGNLRLVWNPEREIGGKPSELPQQWQGYPMTERASWDSKVQGPRSSTSEHDGGFDDVSGASKHAGGTASGHAAGPTRKDRYGRLPYEEYDRQNKFDLVLDTFPFPATALDTIEDEERYPLGRDVFKLNDMPYLQFWTHAAYFRLLPFPDPEVHAEGQRATGRLNRRWAIIDSINEIRGIIVPDRETLPIGDKWEESRLEKGPHRFLALSDAKEFSPQELKGWEEYKPREVEGLQWNLYYVMLVYEHEGVHYRLGLGKVDKEAFRYSCKENATWKEIILG